jgi:hypothetical protein
LRSLEAHGAKGEGGAEAGDRRGEAAAGALAELAAELGAEPPAALESLSEAEVADLARAVGDARARQSAALAKAGSEALDRLPRLVRGVVRRVIRG